MATIYAAFRDGAGRVFRAPSVLLGVFLVTLLMAVPPGIVIQNSISSSLGHSQDADTAATGVNTEWWDRFSETATGLDGTFAPTIIGFGAVLDNLSRFVDNGAVPPVLLGLVAAYLLIWLFLVGGAIDRYARNRPTRAQAFFGTCGVYFWRFLRLAIVALIGYAFLFGLIHGWLFDGFYGWATDDLTVERTAFLLRLGLYAVFGAVLVFWNVVMDYAKIRAVVEDRHSMLGSVLAAWRFVVGHPLRTGGLYLLNGVMFLAVVAVYAGLAPGAAGAGPMAWLGFAVGQVYLLARLAVKLGFYASQTAMFQRSLAHVDYTAAPMPVWPDSPAAEAIGNAPAANLQ